MCWKEKETRLRNMNICRPAYPCKQHSAGCVPWANSRRSSPDSLEVIPVCLHEAACNYIAICKIKATKKGDERKNEQRPANMCHAKKAVKIANVYSATKLIATRYKPQVRRYDLPACMKILSRTQGTHTANSYNLMWDMK